MIKVETHYEVVRLRNSTKLIFNFQFQFLIFTTSFQSKINLTLVSLIGVVVKEANLFPMLYRLNI